MKILHTANGGSNWQVVDSSSGAIGDVFFGSGDKAWLVKKILRQNKQYAIVYCTTDGGHLWRASNTMLLPNGRSDRPQLMFDPSCHSGWLAITAGGMNSNQTLQLWRTLDGGAHWTLMSNVNPTDFLLGLRNAKNGWAECAHAGAPLSAWLKGPVHSQDPIAEPALYRTTDGGRTWSPQYLPVPDMLSQHDGYVSLGNISWFGYQGYIPVSFSSGQLPYMKWGIYVTKNGGQTWHLYLENGVANNYGANLTKVSFSMVGLTGLFECVTVLHESNNGPYLAKATHLYFQSAPEKRWRQIGIGKTPVPFTQVQFVSNKIGFALTQDGNLYKTKDAGHDWSAVNY